ncbi:MAG: hypothetical protein ACFNZS_00960 [Ottowia sp.]|jgi:hypothetical protein
MSAAEYKRKTWFALLVSRCESTPRAKVARQLGVSPATVSQVLNGSGLYGSGQASTEHIAERVVHTFGRYPCPYLTEEAGGVEQVITAAQCRAYAHRPAPTGSPRDMQHWQACRQCSHAEHSAPPAPREIKPRKPDVRCTPDSTLTAPVQKDYDHV